MHLADAFIQSNLQCIQAIHFLSVCIYIIISNIHTQAEMRVWCIRIALEILVVSWDWEPGNTLTGYIYITSKQTAFALVNTDKLVCILPESDTLNNSAKLPTQSTGGTHTHTHTYTINTPLSHTHYTLTLTNKVCSSMALMLKNNVTN